MCLFLWKGSAIKRSRVAAVADRKPGRRAELDIEFSIDQCQAVNNKFPLCLN